MKDTKCKRISTVCYISCKLEKDIWKCICICSFLQRRYGKDKPETKEIGYLYGVGEKVVERREAAGIAMNVSNITINNIIKITMNHSNGSHHPKINKN